MKPAFFRTACNSVASRSAYLEVLQVAVLVLIDADNQRQALAFRLRPAPPTDGSRIRKVAKTVVGMATNARLRRLDMWHLEIGNG